MTTFTHYKPLNTNSSPTDNWILLKRMVDASLGVEIQLEVDQVIYEVACDGIGGANAVGVISGSVICHSVGEEPAVKIRLNPILASLR